MCLSLSSSVWREVLSCEKCQPAVLITEFAVLSLAGGPLAPGKVGHNNHNDGPQLAGLSVMIWLHLIVSST